MPLATPSRGIEELVDETSGREVVEAPPVVDRFVELREKYEQFLVGDAVEWILENIHDVLLPSDINLFLQQTREYEDNSGYHLHTGDFISKLIHNSYDAGHSDFELDVRSLKPIDSLSFGVSWTKERMVKVIITGQVGRWFGYGAQYSTFTLGETGDRCGALAYNSTFTIGKAGVLCGHDARHSIFKTHSKSQYERFKSSIEQKIGNTIYLLSSDGSILNGGPW